MPRERSPNRNKAKEMYLNSKGEMKLKDIAEALGVLDTQIRKWKSTDKWEQELKGTLPKDNKSKRNVPNDKTINEKRDKEPKLKEVEEIINNSELTDKQRLFCVIYARRMNATKAYQQAYRCTYETAMANGPRLLGNAKIKEQVDSLTQLQFNKEALKRSVIQKYIDIAFADITDYVKFGQDYYIVKDKDGNPQIDDEGKIITKPYNYVRLGESNQVDGTLISEIAEGKDGVKIKLADKMKALDFLTKHCNLLSDEEKIKLEIENKKLQNAKLEAEVAKAGEGLDNELKIIIDYGDADGSS